MIKYIYEEFKYVSEHSGLRNYLFDIKTNIFHVFFNAWMSVLTIMTLILLTGEFGVSSVELEKFLFYVPFFPVVIISSLALLYGIFVVFLANRKLYIIFKEYHQNEDVDLFTKNTEKVYRHICFAGCILYIIAGIVAMLIAKADFLHNYITNDIVFFASTIALVTLFGVVWNIASYCRLTRLNYERFLNIQKNNKPKNPERKFKKLVIELLFELIGCLLTVISLLVYYYNINVTSENVSFYQFFYLICFTLICFYVRQIYKWEFSRNCNQVVYPTKSIFIE